MRRCGTYTLRRARSHGIGGPTVPGALRGVTAEVAGWRPYPDRHSIWALALHVAYWNYAVERRLTEAPHHWNRPARHVPRWPYPNAQAHGRESRTLTAEHGR